MSEIKHCAAWVQIRANRDTSGKVIDVKAVHLTQKRPTITDPDVRLIRLALGIPVGAFDEIAAHVTVPPEAVEAPTLSVEAERMGGDDE